MAPRSVCRRSTSLRLPSLSAVTDWCQAPWEAVNALSFNPALTVTELSEELDLSPRQVQMATKELRDGGVIERVGSDKNGTWKILRHLMS